MVIGQLSKECLDFLYFLNFFKVKYILEFLEFLLFFIHLFFKFLKIFQPEGIGESLLNFTWPQFSYYFSFYMKLF